jgi:type IV pilus assembly protein PilW
MTRPATRPTRHAGFTIIEFMIAMTLSLLVLSALTATFVANSRSRGEIEKANEQIENGRFALQILSDDVEMAGFYSQFNIDNALAADPAMPIPAAKPNPCLATLASLRSALPLHVQGYDSPAAIDTDLDDCLSDVKANTDIVVIRRTATCVRGAANCAAVADAPYFQAALSSAADQLGSLNNADYYDLDTNIGNLDRKNRTGGTADMRQYLTHIYFIASNDQAGDGVPTLKRAELVEATGTAADDFTIVPLAHGIQDLQIEYGIDTDADGAPNVFVASPDTYDAPGGATGPFTDCAAHATECIGNWRNVMALRLNVLAVNSSVTRDYLDTKTYVLAGVTQGPFNDAYKRHLYQTSVRLMNPAGRLE